MLQSRSRVIGVGKRQIRTITISQQHMQYDYEDFFRFTRGRFLRDETRELSQRYVRFNVDELARMAVLAAQVTSPAARQCVKIDKWADGMHSKALLFTMDNGFQAVGKVPNPNAGRPHFTTASEVATMDFMRNIVRTPVPKVLAWSSTAENPVGAEYVLMEKLNGVQLDAVWEQLDVEVKLKVVKRIATYQEAWMSTCFSQYGSLYYKQDLPSSTPSLEYIDKDGKKIVDDRFAIGPSSSRQNTDDGRVDVEFDRGPWATAEEYELATGFREMSCIQSLPRLPESPIAIYYSGTYQPSRENKLVAVQSYLKLVKYLLPEDESIQTSHIWHDDLHTENIFVNPNDPAEIYGFIDWQSTELAPLYDHTLEPYVLDYEGPPLEGLLERPRLADIRQLFHDEPDPAAQRKAESLFTRMSLVSLYRHLVHKRNGRLFRAIQFRETPAFQLLLFARNLLVDGEATYLALLAQQQQQGWTDIPRLRDSGDRNFPVSFSAEELSAIETDNEGATSGIQLMQEVQERIGRRYFRAQGLVSHEQFDEVKRILRTVKEEFLRSHARNGKEMKELEDAWPFDD